MEKEFYTDFNFKNEIWKIYTINKDESLNYFNTSNKNNVNETDLNLPDTQVNNCNYINLSNKILYSILDDDNMEFLNVLDNKFYNVYNIYFNYRDSAVILYYCNENDPFIVVQTSVYMDFHHIFYPSKKEIMQISDSSGYGTYYIADVINTIKFVNNITTPITPVTNYKKYLFFGFNMNLGHHLWNEVSALFYFLKNKKYHNKIEGIIMGPYDSFNLQKFLKNNYGFNILKFTDLFDNCRHFHFKNLTNIFPIFLNSFYIDENIKKLINYIDDENILEISIDIRTFRRHLINQDIFYTKLIQNLLDHYNEYKIKINFLGCFQTHSNMIDKKNNSEFIEQNKIVNTIIQNFYENSNIVCKNFIGESFNIIKNEVIKSKLFISTAGTSISNLLNWIYNTKQIYFGPIESYNWLFIQFNILKNNDLIVVPKEYIITDNGLQEPFDIDFPLFYDFLKKQLDDSINNTIKDL
jgi:hypothetical protein